MESASRPPDCSIHATLADFLILEPQAIGNNPKSAISWKVRSGYTARRTDASHIFASDNRNYNGEGSHSRDVQPFGLNPAARTG